MYNVILINGKKRSGKDYFANALKKELENRGYDCEIMAFADSVKDMLCTSLNISLEDFDNYKNSNDSLYVKNDPEFKPVIGFRNLIQNFATEAMKPVFGEDVWVRIFLEKVYSSHAKFIIVPDFRFLCEHFSDFTVKIVNNDLDTSDDHRSENELNDFEFDYTIDNTGYRDISNDVKEYVEYLL